MKRYLWLLAFLAIRAWGEPTSAEVVAKLDELQATLAEEVTTALATNRYTASYTTVWRNFEDDAQVAFTAVLRKHLPALTEKNFDTGQAGSEKNRLADLAIVCGKETIEVSVKAARAGQNPENDMGTFREHPNRRKVFVASFTLFGRYGEAEKSIRVDRVFFDRTYRFVGQAAHGGGVKYRKKDGNMRPKPWSMFDAGKSCWASAEDFEAAVERSAKYRANELVKEYLGDLTEPEQRLLYEQLKRKFGE